MNKKKKETLADKISSILTSAPTNFDPEEDVSDVTTAPLIFDENEDNCDYDEAEEEILSKFRKENIDLLADVDNKYAGKRASRKSLKDSDDDSSEDDDDSNEEHEEEASNNSGSEEEEEEGEPNSYSEEDSESGSDADDDEFGDESIIENEANDPNFKHLNDSDTSTQLKKAICVRNQMSMWENLLEVRIQLQKSLITANKMPQKESFMRIKQELDPEFSTKLAETKQNLSGVLNKLLNLQELVLKQYPETKKLDSLENGEPLENDDEEIPSDSDPENSDLEEGAVSRPAPAAGRKRKLEEYEREIKEQHNKYKKYRDSVIHKWNDKARIAQKNNTNPHSILDQIAYNLSNREKLIKRTQFKRSQYEILGKEPETEAGGSANSREELDSEIFDDDDFYHQLLRELIEVKSADVTDPVQLGRQWIQLQNLRSKMKRKIDTKATKGRKIRYAVHTKLVNFMAPVDEHAWTDEAKTELYNSLFAKNQIACNT